jgi:hypothetical protein
MSTLPHSNPYLSRYFAARRWLTLGLTIAGALSGAVIGAALTVLGKVVAEAPPATLSNYLWNLTVFGALGAVASPLITWSALRRVPLWRTVVEPLGAALVGASIGVLAGSGVLFLALTPLGAGVAIVRLSYSHRR